MQTQPDPRKPFNAAEWTPDKKVETRDGRKVRVLCVDVKSKWPVAAIIQHEDQPEAVGLFTSCGKFSADHFSIDHPLDLFFAPRRENRWIVSGMLPGQDMLKIAWQRSKLGAHQIEDKWITEGITQIEITEREITLP